MKLQIHLTMRQIAIFSLLLLFLSACQFGGKKVEVISKNFDEEIALQQNMNFKFSKDLIGPHKVSLNKWIDSTGLASITPAVAGKFKWVSPRELVFSPEKGFLPSTNYQMAFTDKLLEGAEKKMGLGNSTTFNFHTAYLKIKTVDIAWVSKESSPSLQLILNFNYPVQPKELKSLLKITLEGKSVEYQIVNSDISDELILDMPEVPESEGKTLKLEVAEGLTTAKSEYIAKKMIADSTVPVKSAFKVLRAVANVVDSKPYISVITSQSVGSEYIQNFVSLTPEVNFDVEKTANGFLLKGDFRLGKNYKVSVNQNLRGIFQNKLGQTYDEFVSFGEIEPTLAFSEKKAIYLTSAGKKQVALQVVNVEDVYVKVYKIYANNITHFLDDNGIDNSYFGEYGDDYYRNIGGFGDIIFEQNYKTANLKEEGNLKLLKLDFIDKNNLKGMYVLEIQSSENLWKRTSKLIGLSDIGLIAKQGENEIFVWANSILTAEPLSDVEITLVSSNNQSVYKASTDADGLVRIPDLDEKAPDFRISMITATMGKDFNFMSFGQNHLETYQYEVSGYEGGKTGLQAYMYGDRNLYRPNETAHIKALVRDGKWKAAGELPIKFTIESPTGNQFLEQKGMLSASGSYETSIQFPADATTGTYHANLYTSNDVLLHSYAISVEEFMPDRIKIMLDTDKEKVYSGEDFALNAQAFNLFGTPAANRKYTVYFSLSKKYFSPKGLEDYNFGLSGKQNYFNAVSKSGTTDSEGKIKQDFTIPENYRFAGLLEGELFLTVFDETGRSVSRFKKIEVATQDAFYGIRNIDRYVNTKQTLQIPIVAVSREGKVFNSKKANVQILRHTWHSVLEKDYSGKYRYVSQKKEENIMNDLVEIKGLKTSIPFVPNFSGSYEIRVFDEGSETYVSQRFYAYGNGTTTNSAFEVDKEGKILISRDKESYAVGEKAKVLFKMPFAGKLLVTVEKDKIIKHYAFTATDKKSESFAIPITEEMLPNAYISATLIKPATDNGIPLTVAYGYEPIRVEKPENKIELEIVAADKSRSKIEQSVMVRTKKPLQNVEMTIAVVDEGILQLKNFETPNPYEHFYQKRALGVNSYDMYPRLFPEYGIKKEDYGAGDYDMKKRINPLANKRVKLISFWSGTVKTDAKGEARYKFKIPQFSGALRIMAVASKEGAFGSASKMMEVADPVVISTALPRFASPNDVLDMPVILTNTTDAPVEVTAKVSVSGEMQLTGKSEQSIKILPNSERVLPFKLKASNSIGQASVMVEVNNGSEVFTNKTDLPVRPSTSLLKTSEAGMVKGGEVAKLDFKQDFISSSIEAKLLVSKSPVAQFTDHLAYLVRYPHGCVEQTVSAAFPQLYFSDLSKSLGKSEEYPADPNFHISEAIKKLQAMQLYNGGLAYWQGGTTDSWWGTAYATHFLFEAQKTGFEVDKPFMNKLYRYLKNQVRRNRFEDYQYYDAQGKLQLKKIIPRESIYSLYVLALTGQPEVASMNAYKKTPEALSLDAKYMLAAAYMLASDKASYQQLLPPAFAGEKSVSSFGGSFHSYIRDQAIALNTLLEVDADNPQVGMMAKQLSEQLKRQKWLNTQERAFSLLALGKLAQKANNSTVQARIMADGKEIGSLQGASLSFSSSDLAGKNITLNTSGEGNLYYFWEMEGLNSTGKYIEEDKFLKVRRTFYSQEGKVLSPSDIKQNDLVVVEISLQSSTAGSVENVVVTDMLPAGLEVENPRIGTLPQIKWIKNAGYPQHTDFRDDRVHFFTTATPQPRNFYYMTRAVSTGTFKLGPVSADAMYNGEYHSYHGGGVLVVK